MSDALSAATLVSPPRVYLDNGATSWPKPPEVYAAVDRYLRQNGAPAGRGVYREALDSAAMVTRTRRKLAQLFNSTEPQRFVFTLNGTDSLNLALHGLLDHAESPTHVVTTAVEHNSVLRPLRSLEQRGTIEVTRVACDAKGLVSVAEIKRAMRPQTRLVVLNQASNVTGTIQPAAEALEIAHAQGALLLVDAAQTAGELPWSEYGPLPDLLAAPGHKGLLGPLGTGLLYVSAAAESQLAATRQGGTGTHSESEEQPTSLPEKYEAGNLNLPGIAGLEAGLDWLAAQGEQTLRTQALQLTERLLEGLRSIEAVTIWGPTTAAERVGLVSVTVQGYDPQELATLLDSAYGVQARGGLHCAPLVHRSLGTLAAGGTLRFSLGPFNTAEHVDQAVQALRELAS